MLGNINRLLQTIWCLWIIIFLSVTSNSGYAQNNVELKSFKGSVEGTSNFRDWKSDILNITCKGWLDMKNKKIESVKHAEIKILVESIKGKEGEAMDRKTYESFKYDKHPYIIYTFATTQVAIDAHNNVTIAPLGNLTMAGTTRQIPFLAKGKILPNGDLQVYVSKKIKLSDFNIEPPTALLGAVKVGDEIDLNFELLLKPTEIPR